MKKILSAIVLSVFTMFLVSPLYSVVFAAGGSDDSDIGINFGHGCLTGMGRKCFHYEKIMGIDKEQPDYTATSIAQDLIFAATYIIGTVLTVVMIACGLGYIFAARGGNDTTKYKKGLTNAAIGAVLVRGAYAIVRLVQYIAAG